MGCRSQEQAQAPRRVEDRPEAANAESDRQGEKQSQTKRYKRSMIGPLHLLTKLGF
jgi:hypothetical protein